MEYCNWYESSFRENVELIFKCNAKDIPNIEPYVKATEQLFNEGTKLNIYVIEIIVTYLQVKMFTLYPNITKVLEHFLVYH